MPEQPIHPQRRVPAEHLTQQQGPRRHGRPVNTRRRNLLKFGAFGVGAFVLGKIFGPSLNLFGGVFDENIYDLKNFRIVENSQGLGFFDKLGNEILILENDPNAGK